MMANCQLHLPVLSRFDFGLLRSPGPGLGNLLLPISRALIGAKRFGGEFVFPTMRQFKIGTYLRNEPDKRTYGDVFRGRNWDEWRLWFNAKLSRQKVLEGDATPFPNAVRTYSGLGKYFHDLQGHDKLIENWIRTNARLSGAIDDYDIGVLIRLGDYTDYIPNSPRANVRLPFSWYDSAIKMAIEIADVNSPDIVFFSDADESEIAPIIAKWKGRFNPGKNAVTDMLNLSKGRVAVTSRSTFSMWSTFLSDSHAIWDEEFDLERCFPERDGLDHRVPVPVDD